MLQRITSRTLSSSTAKNRFAFHADAKRQYWQLIFQNPARRPQLNEEERKTVTVNQENWPEEFKDFDPADPYKYSPDWIEGLSAFSLLLAGIELAFVFTFFELCFPYSI